MSKIVVILPTYNESNNIVKMCESLLVLGLDLDILIIDDSLDEVSLNLVQAKKYKNVKYIHRKNKGGRGSAVLQGLKLAHTEKYDYYVEMDTDFSHSPEEIPGMLLSIQAQNADVVIGSRYLKRSRILNWPLARRIFSFLANKLAAFLLKLPFADCTNGFRMYSHKAAGKIVNQPQFYSTGFSLLTECLALLYYAGYKIIEMPAVFVNRERGESKLSFKEIKSALKVLFVIAKIYRKRL
ncbi:glycosyltransferase [bacterium]|nr:glycosyltransferase [bacterium]